MVGLPCGQFQGCSISPMWSTSFFISLMLRAVPTITCVNRKTEHTIHIKTYQKEHKICNGSITDYDLPLQVFIWVHTGGLYGKYFWQEEKLATLTDLRQALDANICLTREGRHMIPGLSLSMKMSSSMSLGPKVQFLLVGRDTSFTLSITWADKQHPTSIWRNILATIFICI